MPRLVYLVSTLALAAPLLCSPARAEVAAPQCDALESWSKTFDKTKTFLPFEGAQQELPEAFGPQAFEQVFGAPALDWTSAEANDMAAAVYACAKAAGRAGRRDVRETLYDVRLAILRNLRPILGQARPDTTATEPAATAKSAPDRAQPSSKPENTQAAESAPEPKPSAAEARAAARELRRAEKAAIRAEQERQRAKAQADARAARLENSVQALIAAPDSLDLLHDLATLEAIEPTDAVSARAGSALKLKPSRQLLFDMRGLNVVRGDPRVAPRLAERRQALHDRTIQEKLAEIDALPDSSDAIRAARTALPSLAAAIGPALREEDKSVLGEAIARKIAGIQSEIVERGRRLIDDAPEGAAGIARIDKIASQIAGAGLTAEQARGLMGYARARQTTLADAVLEEAAPGLEKPPETLAGLDALGAYVTDRQRAVHGRASQPAMARFIAAATTRATTIADAALPEFEENLARLPENPDGREAARRRLAYAQGLRIDDALKAEYVAAARDRIAAIDGAIDAARAAERQAALDAGADPRVAGYVFVEPNTGSSIEFRDESLAMMNMVGIRGAVDYKVSRDDVIIKGPHSTLVFTLEGDALTGMGLVFKRR